MLDWLKGKKTYVTCVGGIVAAVVAMVEGSVTPQEGCHAILECLLVLFLRAGIKKVE